MAAAPYPQLEGQEVLVQGYLADIVTGDKKYTVTNIRENTDRLKVHPLIDKLRREQLDVAIIVQIQNQSFLRQDVDNIAKVVLDALKKSKKEDNFSHLFEDDRQIVRLLIYKMRRIENPDYNTCQISISVRKHDPTKEMKLILNIFRDGKTATGVSYSDFLRVKGDWTQLI